MTSTQKAKLLFDRLQAITLNQYIATECAILFTDEMIRAFQAIVKKYSKDFQQSVDYWVDVRKELLVIAAK